MALAKPEATTWIILFVLYSNLAVVAKRDHNVPEYTAACFFLLLLIPLFNYVFLHRQRIVLNGVFLVMLGYLALLLVSAGFSRDPLQSRDRLLGYLVEGLVLYFLVINTVRTPYVLRGALWALITAGALMGTVSLYQEWTGSYDDEIGGLGKVKESVIEIEDPAGPVRRRRLAGTIGSKNRFAQVLVVLLPLAVSRIWTERSRMLRGGAALSCIPILSGALLTFSRAAGVAIIMTLAAMVLLRTIRVRHAIYAGIAGVGIILLFVPQYVYRFSSVFDVMKLASGNFAEAGSSVRGRATVNRAAILIFVDHPILGVGPGQTNLYTTEYGNDGGFRALDGTRRAHNMYLEELADTGLVGFCCFMAIVLITLRQLLVVRRECEWNRPEFAHTAAGLALAIVAYLFTGLFLHLSYVRYYWLLLALGAAAVQIFRSEAKELTLAETRVYGRGGAGTTAA